MDHARKETMETTWPLISRASQRPAIITQGLRGSSSLSPALPGRGCPLSLPGPPVLCRPRTPTPGFPALAFGAALAVSLSFCFSHQLCLCVLLMCMVAEPNGPHHANPTSATACGQVSVKRLRNFLGLSYVCVCERGLALRRFWDPGKVPPEPRPPQPIPVGLSEGASHLPPPHLFRSVCESARVLQRNNPFL